MDSITQELANQVAFLEQRLKALENENKSLKYQEFSADLRLLSTLPPIKVAGIMIGEGVWNGVTYTKEELRKAYERIKKLGSKIPVDVEHGRTEKYKDRIVGEVEKVDWNEDLGTILCVAKITDPEAVEDVKKGILRGFSSAVLPDQEVDKNIRLAKNIMIPRVTLTATPAVDFALITRRMELLSRLNTSDAEAKPMEKQEVKAEAPPAEQPKEQAKEQAQTETVKESQVELVKLVKGIEEVLKQVLDKQANIESKQASIEAKIAELEAKKKAVEQAETPRAEAPKTEAPKAEVKQVEEAKPLEPDYTKMSLAELWHLEQERLYSRASRRKQEAQEGASGK